MRFTALLAWILVAAFGGAVEAAQPPGVRVKPSSFPAPHAGFSTIKVGSPAEEPNGSDDGSFRISCRPSHYGYDDPIINQTPGTPNLSHLHLFFGAIDTNQNTDITINPQVTAPNTTCSGGIINRTRYWVPAMINTRNGNIVQASNNLVYYKGNYIGLANLPNMQPIPTNFRAIAGNSTATSFQGSGSDFQFQCVHWTGTAFFNDLVSASKSPYCEVGASEVWQAVNFGQCLSTTGGIPDIDSPDHKSHVAHWDFAAGSCPASHPYLIPHISYNITYAVTADMKYWRLASDGYTGPGGYSNHGDFRMGWMTDYHLSWLNGCLRLGRDCHAHLLGCRVENNNVVQCRYFFE